MGTSLCHVCMYLCLYAYVCLYVFLNWHDFCHHEIASALMIVRKVTDLVKMKSQFIQSNCFSNPVLTS